MSELRELTYKALTQMEGQRVIVKDIQNDIYDQECIVKAQRQLYKNPWKKKNVYETPIVKLWLENEEYIFQYEFVLNEWSCKDGEFKVYGIKESKKI